MRTSVIIPNWNGLEMLKKCLPSIQKQTAKDFEVIIVDNGSSDGSVEYIEKNFKSYKIIKLKSNVGFSPAVNLGIKKASGDYLVLINNDTELDKNCLQYLIKAADEQREVGMVAAKMLNFYQRDVIDSAGDYIDVVGHADNIGRGEKDGSLFGKEGYIFLVTGGGGLFKREVFEKVGLFDEEYFAYMEDVDLCLRAQLKGYKAWFEPKALIYHIHKATSSRNPKLREYLQFRNMTLTIIKDFPRSLILQNFNWLKIILVNLNTVRFLFSQGYGGSALRAEAFVLMNLGRLLLKRKIIQSQTLVDLDYFNSQFREKKLKMPLFNVRV